MNTSNLRKIKKGIYGLYGFVKEGLPLYFNYGKKELIDYAFNSLNFAMRSIADLGGVWKINGAYTFYALDHYPVKNAIIVDTNLTPKVLKKSSKYPNLILINDNFGSETVLDKINSVDGVLMFDILLHQVKPDWNEILEMYSKISRVILIYNQQYIGAERSIRLLDLGQEEYIRLIPFARSNRLYQDLFSKPDEIHPEYKRPWRDIHNVWQWGITNHDLYSVMDRLGFELKFHKNYGQFSNLNQFEDHAFIFVKK
jgi:hypothetical protein